MIRAGTKIILLGGKMKVQEFFLQDDRELYYVAIHHDTRLFDLFIFNDYQSHPVFDHPFAVFVCKGTFESHRWPKSLPEISVDLIEPDWLRNSCAPSKDCEEA